MNGIPQLHWQHERQMSFKHDRMICEFDFNDRLRWYVLRTEAALNFDIYLEADLCTVMKRSTRQSDTSPDIPFQLIKPLFSMGTLFEVSA